MSAEIIDGKAIAQQIRAEVGAEVAALAAQGKVPGLAVVLVGDDPASQTYVNNKERICKQLGMYSVQHRLPADSTQADVLALVRQLNADPQIHGILVQSPMGKQIDEPTVFAALDPAKDVDGFHPINVGRLQLGQQGLVPCTPAGIMVMLERSGVQTRGARAVVIGRSPIVGKPVAALLTNADATVTICHSKTRDLPAVCREADIVVAAIGRAGFVTAEFIKPGAAVIDVGINRTAEGKLVGDVAYDAVAAVAGKITPVPGGVGPVTIAMLMRSTLEAAKAIW